MPNSVLITGCDTGVGREFAIQYARLGWRVIATHLDPSNRLTPTETDGNVEQFQLDVTRPDHFASLKQKVGSEPIDVLLSNAGVGIETARFGDIDYDYALQMYQTNAIGPLRLAETFVDNVSESELRRIVAVSSRMGSIGSNLTGGHYGYRASKAGLNAMMRSLAVDLSEKGISVIILHPGAVAVPSTPDGPISAADAVEGMRLLIERLGPHETGQFHRFNGEPIPW